MIFLVDIPVRGFGVGIGGVAAAERRRRRFSPLVREWGFMECGFTCCFMWTTTAFAMTGSFPEGRGALDAPSDG
jgi:hypothetical protein